MILNHSYFDIHTKFFYATFPNIFISLSMYGLFINLGIGFVIGSL